LFAKGMYIKTCADFILSGSTKNGRGEEEKQQQMQLLDVHKDGQMNVLFRFHLQFVFLTTYFCAIIITKMRIWKFSVFHNYFH